MPGLGGGGPGGGVSRLETLPDGVIEKLRRREFAIGEIIGERYRLKSSLGEGAMGQVFVAENLAIGVEVAVKLLKAELIANQEFRQRFQKEAEAVASISHQNVARFFDLVVGDPTFLVMEFVEGPMLHELLEQEGRLAYDRAVNIAVRLCWGLEAAHAHGIVHRDLKPANIIVADDPEVGEQPKIIDFGLAKLAATTEKAQLTRTGQIVGTPEFMAPEQIEGRKIDARADVYALGCVLYNMIAGRSPFGGDDDVQILYRQLHEAPVPLTEIVPGIPSKIDEVMARALAKTPEDRYRDTRAFAYALNAAYDRRRSTPAHTAQTELPRRKPPPLALIAATTLAVGVVGGLLLARHGLGGSTAPAVVLAAGGEPPPAREMLIVTTEPTGATVELDGKALAETTPTAVRGVAVGPHTVKITHPGYGAVERPVTISAGDRASLDVLLPPQTRQIHVSTIPSGATVFLEDRVISSSTPADITVLTDEFYTLRVEKLGFEPLIKHITPDDTARDMELRLDEEKQPMGYLWIDTNGAGEVWIDGRDTGYSAPTFGLRVTAGQHAVELRDSSGAHSKPLKVKVAQGESLHVMLDISGRK